MLRRSDGEDVAEAPENLYGTLGLEGVAVLRLELMVEGVFIVCEDEALDAEAGDVLRSTTAGPPTMRRTTSAAALSLSADG